MVIWGMVYYCFTHPNWFAMPIFFKDVRTTPCAVLSLRFAILLVLLISRQLALWYGWHRNHSRFPTFLSLVYPLPSGYVKIAIENDHV